MTELVDASLSGHLVDSEHPYETTEAGRNRSPLRVAAALQVAFHLRSYTDPREAAEQFPTLGSVQSARMWWVYFPQPFLDVLEDGGVRIFGALARGGRIERKAPHNWSGATLSNHARDINNMRATGQVHNAPVKKHGGRLSVRGVP